jgi:hypothetical protein
MILKEETCSCTCPYERAGQDRRGDEDVGGREGEKEGV